MDSLTQIVLGASVGAVVGGKQYGKKAALLGAIMGTMPDLDVIFSDPENPIYSMTAHRGFSHSILFAVLATPLFAFLISKIKYFKTSFRDVRLHILVFLAFLTHMLLDAMTIYGTQLFWPSSIAPVGVGSIFIIDLLYTLPVIVGLIWFLCTQSIKAASIGLIISTLYLIWSASAQYYVTQLAKSQLPDTTTQILAQPTPFNTLLWRVVAMTDQGYDVGYYSLFDKDQNIKFKKSSSSPALKKDLQDTYAVSRMSWFTKGFYDIRTEGNQIILADLRMGLEPDQYVFQFVIAEQQNGEIVETPNKRFSNRRDLSALSKIWARIWDDNVEL